MQDEHDMTDPLDRKSASEGSSNPDSPKPDLLPQNVMDKQCSCGKASCSCSEESNTPVLSYVYAIGKVVHHFPTKSLQMELTQALGRKADEEARGRTREEVISRALSDPDNRYIARQVCYVLNIEGLETYILIATDPIDIDKLARALRPAPNDGDIDVIIGTRGPIAPPEMCNGLMIPIVHVDQIYSFDRNALMKSVPRRKGVSEDQFKKTFDAQFKHIIQIADNVGGTDEHRALNYLVVRYDEIYHRAQIMQDENYLFIAIDVRPSRLSGVRKIVDVIFSYESLGARGAVQKWFIRVDVTEEFPFLVTPMQQFFER